MQMKNEKENIANRLVSMYVYAIRILFSLIKWRHVNNGTQRLTLYQTIECLDWSKLKAFEDDKANIVQIIEIIRMENIVVKR